jgi:hypothetical protein
VRRAHGGSVTAISRLTHRRKLLLTSALICLMGFVFADHHRQPGREADRQLDVFTTKSKEISCAGLAGLRRPVRGGDDLRFP